MEILHEAVQTIPRLPFKFYEHDPLTPITVNPHWHQGIELNYLKAGDPLKFVTDGHTTEYRPGDLWAVNRRVVHSATGPEQVDWDEFGLIIDDDFLTNRVPESVNWQLNLNGAVSSQAHPNAYRLIREHLVAIRQLLKQSPTDLLRLEILSHFYGLLATLGHVFTTPLVETDVNPNTSLVDDVMTAINQRYAEPITGNTLAHEFHVSLTTLNQQFNANVQLSVNRYLRLIRLMNARRLLLESDLKIEYVAASCGFPNGKTLNRNFKAWKKMTPTEYRQAYARYHRIDTSCL
ncbi:AraC family transcriptional regulator [Lactiplantibacillus garii]|uniref:AraC family transcriptional regulator n=1 Tax=Lactiplantibacillus garii TaxID=2306423 RepID=A0A3R8J979_9LACO|nr:AraC family transcriptional regulator [Lactiplantibacillus garii]RRK11229.1 AraC family transcriptional regulator [Lactiplantibacillus garii]